MLNVIMLTIFLNLIKLGLTSVAEFSNTDVRAPTSVVDCLPA